MIDGKFEDWEGIEAVYLDPKGDTMDRSFRGTDPDTIYANDSGRNDIVSARVVEGAEHVYFMGSTAVDLSPSNNANWMTLLIDNDQSKETGWEGYDLVINYKLIAGSQTQCARWIDGRWKVQGEAAVASRGRDLEIGVPNSLFPRDPGQGFDFKWTDNVSLKSVQSLFLEGDVAPDRRFNFRY